VGLHIGIEVLPDDVAPRVDAQGLRIDRSGEVNRRELSGLVLNRKNSLFVGNARGGRTAAILASLTSTCRRHKVDPQLYLTHLLMNLPEIKVSGCQTGCPISGRSATWLEWRASTALPYANQRVVCVSLTALSTSSATCERQMLVNRPIASTCGVRSPSRPACPSP
jgi:hypothetical protein